MTNRTPLLEAHETFSSVFNSNHAQAVGVAKALTDLYEAWHEAEADAGHDATANQWWARFPDAEPGDEESAKASIAGERQ